MATWKVATLKKEQKGKVYNLFYDLGKLELMEGEATCRLMKGLREDTGMKKNMEIKLFWTRLKWVVHAKHE